MRTTIDKAGRLVIPKELRDKVGLVPGDVEVELDGAGLHLAPVVTGVLVERDGRLVVAGAGAPLTDDDVRELRAADRR